MKIKEVSIQNFYSIRNLTLDFKRDKGIVVIKGKNLDDGGSNGSGKSAIIEAVCFGLTGKTIRKSTEEALVNNSARRNCKVTVLLEVGGKNLKIIRQKKPTKLQLFEDDTEITEDTQSHTQELLNTLLNTNHKVLMSSMFFGQSNDINFLDCSQDDKRNIIRHFLNLENMFAMRDRIKVFKSTFYQLSKEQDAIVREHVSTIENLSAKIEKLKSYQAEYKKEYSNKILNISLEEILELEESCRKWSMMMDLYEKDAVKYGNQLDTLQRALNTDTCTTCGQHLKTKTSKISKEIRFIKKELLKLKKKISTMPEVPIPPISSSAYSKIEEFRALEKEEKNYARLIEESTTKIEKAEKTRVTNDKLYEVMRFWEKAFSEHGLIKYIILNILNYFNDRTNHYLSYLASNKIFLNFNEELQETISTACGTVKYISLSGGEKRKVNLAVLLALKDLLLLTDKDQCDLLFFDEVAENLDEEGVTGLYHLLQQIKKDKTIFVITHNKYLKTLLDSSKRISIIKEKGETFLGDITQ